MAICLAMTEETAGFSLSGTDSSYMTADFDLRRSRPSAWAIAVFRHELVGHVVGMRADLPHDIDTPLLLGKSRLDLGYS